MDKFKAPRCRRHRSGVGIARGRTVDARRKLRIVADLGNGLLLGKNGGVVATKLFYIKSGVDGAWGDFKRFCRRHDLDWKYPKAPLPKEDRWYEWVDGKRVDVLPDKDLSRPFEDVVAVEVSGRVEFLADLVLKRFVARWEDCLDVGAPRFNSRMARDPG